MTWTDHVRAKLKRDKRILISFNEWNACTPR